MQLLRLRPAFADHEVVFVTVNSECSEQVKNARFYRVNDATRWNKFGLLQLVCRLFWIMLRERPDVIVTTGASPGYLGLVLGKVFRARTIWLDSMANVDQLSLSGEWAGRHADLWLTQWPELARENGPYYAGAVL